VARSGLGYSPRRAIRKAWDSGEPDHETDRALFACLGCDRCVAVCPSGLVISDVIVELRREAMALGRGGTLAHGGVVQSFMRLQATLPQPQNRLGWLDSSLRTSPASDTVLFTGCAPYFERIFDYPGFGPVETIRNAIRLLNHVGIEPSLLEDERCCGHDLLWLGDVENFRRLAERNLAQLAATRAKRIVFACPECLRTFKLDYEHHFGKTGLELLHVTELLARESEKLGLKPVAASATFHDPCRLGRHLGIYEPPRRLLDAVPGLKLTEMKHSREAATCCGGTAWVECGSAVKCLQGERLAEAAATGADLLVTACPKCDIHLRCALCGGAHVAPRIVNLIDLLAQSLGLSSPEVPAGEAVPAREGG
jgi:Fe-S oxidoreductase